VETALIAGARSLAVLGASALMVALIGALALTGRSPGLPELHFEPHGIVPAPPAAVTAAEIRTGRERIAFRRRPHVDTWTFDQSNAPAVPAQVASHLEMALHFMHVSEPTRSLDPSEYEGTSFADFGLDPPAYLVSLGKGDGSVFVADFGTLNPASTSQYVRLIGQPTLYLMPRHVGTEWEVTADMARRILPPDAATGDDGAKRLAGLLLPASIDRVWAIEILFEGKLHRFERDGAGNWLLHVGQHTHTSNSDAHVADPAHARIISAALAALDLTQIEAVVARHPGDADLERYGLSRPMLIALMYARDSSSPLARLAIGNMTGDGFSRYARLSAGDVVTIAAYKATGMVELLKAVGAAS
jgi:hypothetical protein